MNPILLALDPGKAGGFAIQWPDGKITSGPLPDTDGGLLEQLRFIQVAWDTTPRICHLEDIVRHVKNSPIPASSMCVYAASWGTLKGMLMALDYRLVLVRPQEWQKTLGLGSSRGIPRTQWKAKLKGEAERLFPGQKVTLATADALLILEAAKRTERG